MIERLFTSKNRVKILGFLFFEKEESYIREIARELKVSSGVVKREIDNLDKIGVVRKIGSKIVLNKECVFLDELKNILVKSDFIFYPVKFALRDLNLNFVILYGSYAKGNFDSESDVDLLVVGEVLPSKIYTLIDSVGDKFGKEVNAVVWSIDELKKKKSSAFIRDILKNRKIMIIGGEDEFKRIVR